MELPPPLRRVLEILVAGLGVGAIGLGISAMRSAAPTPVHFAGQAAAGEAGQPSPDLEAMLKSVNKPPAHPAHHLPRHPSTRRLRSIRNPQSESRNRIRG